MSKKEKLVKLDGTIIHKDGDGAAITSYKSNYFSFLKLKPEDYSDITYTEEEALRIKQHMLHLSTGATAAIPLICPGEVICPFARKCPLVLETHNRRKVDPTAPTLVPVGRTCPVESDLLNLWTTFYIEEYAVLDSTTTTETPNTPSTSLGSSFTELQMCRELAEIDLLLWRVNNSLSKSSEATLIQDDIVAIDKEGNVLKKRSISALFEVKEKLSNRKSRLVKLMVGDRQEKYKRDSALKTRDLQDSSSRTSELKSQLNKLISRAREIEKKVALTDGSIIDVQIEEVNTPVQDNNNPSSDGDSSE